MSGSDLKPSLAVLERLKTASVLTVSNVPRFAETGGMVELFLENGRMRMAVNVDALHRSQVRLSSRVLVLAKIVRDTVPQESPPKWGQGTSREAARSGQAER